MIRHIVILKLKENSPIQEIKKEILNLKKDIKEIINIEVGVDIRFDKNPSDLSIIADFKNIKDLDIYANHPKHIEIIEKLIKPNLIQRSVVDYELIWSK